MFLRCGAFRVHMVKGWKSEASGAAKTVEVVNVLLPATWFWR